MLKCTGPAGRELKQLNRIKVGIVARGLIIVAIPLAFSCYFVATLLVLQNQAENAASKAEHDREISTLISELLYDLYMGIGSVKLKADNFSTNNNRKDQILEAKAKVGKLLNLLQNEDPSARNILLSVQADIDKGNQLISRAEKAFSSGNKVELLRLRLEAQALADRLISPELIALGERREAVSAGEPSIEQELREQMRTQLWASLIISIAATLTLSLITTRALTRRLADLTANSRRIASGEALVEAIPGSDEIAELDQVFHKMAGEIENLIQRERIILESAGDLILVTDNKLNILKVSPSVENILAIKPNDLLSKSCLDLLAPTGNQVAREKLSKASAGEDTDNFEARLTKSTGEVIDFLVSLSRVPEEALLILIFHDVSRLKEVERFKQQVVSMVSHDLRSPLTAVGHTLEMFESGMFGDLNQEGQALLRQAEHSTRKMSLLIVDLLALDKIESGKLKLSIGSVSCRTLMETAQTVSPEARIEIAECTGRVLCDLERTNQVFAGLIKFALKLCGAPASLLLTSQVKSPQIEFSIAFNTSTLPEGQQASLFERFVLPKEEHDTAGLALTISKALIELQGGSIEYRNKLGFVFTLPEAKS